MDYPKLLDTLARLHPGIQAAMDMGTFQEPQDVEILRTTSRLESVWLDARTAALAAFRRDDPEGYEEYRRHLVGRDGKPLQS